MSALLLVLSWLPDRTFNMGEVACRPTYSSATGDSLSVPEGMGFTISSDISVGPMTNMTDGLIIYRKGEPSMVLSYIAADALSNLLSGFVKLREKERGTLARN